MSGEQVRVTLPCTPAYARVARTVAASCGVVQGFSVDELGDLRLLVDEVFVAMYELGAAAVELVMAADGGLLAVDVRAVGPLVDRRGPAESAFVRMLAELIATDVRCDLEPPTPSFTARLRVPG